jgi:single-strand DNA-binding protein
MNLYILTGNLGSDAEVRSTPDGTSVCSFSVAVKSGYGDKAKTIWVDCSIWGKRAEGGLPQYLVKGSQVAVSGELSTREYEGKTYLSVRVGEIDLVGGRPGDAAKPAAQPQKPFDDLDDGSSLPF